MTSTTAFISLHSHLRLQITSFDPIVQCTNLIKPCRLPACFGRNTLALAAWCSTRTSDLRKEQDDEEVAVFDPRMDRTFRNPGVGELPRAECQRRRSRAPHARLGNKASRVQRPALIEPGM